MNRNIDLSRFIRVQKDTYQTALKEIQNGHKISHWMWYIFPQILGLGRSSTSQFYAIQNLEEAIAFLHDPYLGSNLCEISSALLGLESNDPTEIFGRPDDMKLKSSMTLFALISEDDSIFHQVLRKYYGGRFDEQTLRKVGIY